MPDLTGQSLGRYHLLEKLGEGGMAIVYKAYDTRLECDVAVKVIRTDQLAPAVLERALKRFEREAKSVARLTHSNIVKVTDFGEYDGMPYLVMEYLSGGTLKEYLKVHGKIDWRDAVKILMPIADALDYAHEQNLIHRDVKPSNILLTSKGQPMLTDFGVAKIIDEEVTQDLTGTSATVGTPEYMAPEQVVSKTVDHRADVYALGVVFYEMVTGRRPFEADTPMAVLFKHAGEPLPRPSDFIKDLPEVIEKILFKALAKKPEDRYQSMGELEQAFNGLLANQDCLMQAEKPMLINIDAPTMEQMAMKDSYATRDGAVTEKIQQPVKYKPSLANQTPNESDKKTELPKETRRSFPWGVVIICAAIVVIVGFLIRGNGLIGHPSIMVPTKIPTKTPSPTLTTMPSTAPTTLTITPIPPTIMPTLSLAIGSSIVSDKDGMVMMYVPEGEFIMGWNGGYQESPEHTVFLSAYWLDKTEVTNKQYKECISAGYCQNMGESYSMYFGLPYNYYGSTTYDNYPYSNVTWEQAGVYCEWAGKRLPTEAEWEKAARGPIGNKYPWGFEFSCHNGNFNDNDNPPMSSYVPGGPDCDGFQYTSPVGAFPQGASYYGIFDLEGNVSEWVSDWYDGNYYETTDAIDPQGPSSGDEKVIRGTDYGFNQSYYSAKRYSRSPDYQYSITGFRCAMDAD